MGVVASSIKITLRSTWSVLVGVSRPSTMVPWWWAIIVVILTGDIIIVLMGSVPVVAPASLGLGILTPTSLMVGILTSTSLMGLVLILFVRVYGF